MLTNKYYLIRLVYKWHSPELNLIHWNLMVRNGNSDVIQNCWNDACFWAFHTSEAGTAYPSGAPEITPGFNGVRVTLSVVLCVMFCRSLFVLSSFYFWPLCCLSFDLRILITPLVSSNSSSVKFVSYFGFLTLHNKHNIRVMWKKIILHSLWNRLKRAFIYILFFNVIQINLIISGNVLELLYMSSLIKFCYFMFWVDIMLFLEKLYLYV
jgi:hypothetical protein